MDIGMQRAKTVRDLWLKIAKTKALNPAMVIRNCLRAAWNDGYNRGAQDQIDKQATPSALREGG